MTAHWHGVEEFSSECIVPSGWLTADEWGVAGRFNAGVCLLEPDLELLEYIIEQTDRSRHLCPLNDDGSCDTVGD
eukprot:11869936-Alexandrium_andersonii.AAC.1